MEHTLKYGDIHHRKLIDNNGVALKRIALTADKYGIIVLVPIHLKHTVNCFSFLTGDLTHTFGCTACWGSQQNFFTLLLKNTDYGI